LIGLIQRLFCFAKLLGDFSLPLIRVIDHAALGIFGSRASRGGRATQRFTGGIQPIRRAVAA
jgi:hypothetical protein